MRLEDLKEELGYKSIKELVEAHGLNYGSVNKMRNREAGKDIKVNEDKLISNIILNHYNINNKTLLRFCQTMKEISK